MFVPSFFLLSLKYQQLQLEHKKKFEECQDLNLKHGEALETARKLQNKVFLYEGRTSG
jgi:hypothetical protein